MSFIIREMQIEDYDQVLSLWKKTNGIALSSADSKERIEFFLERNKRLCLIAMKESAIIGTALCGHDGRRGYIHHLAVDERHQGEGLGRRLMEMIVERLREIGIQKAHLFVIAQNQRGKEFWKKIGWELREDIQVISKVLEEDAP